MEYLYLINYLFKPVVNFFRRRSRTAQIEVWLSEYYKENENRTAPPTSYIADKLGLEPKLVEVLCYRSKKITKDFSITDTLKRDRWKLKEKSG